ncbi:MAG: nucleotidyltransferase domain-containing protein, partial [Acidimicrobiales bacterium]
MTLSFDTGLDASTPRTGLLMDDKRELEETVIAVAQAHGLDISAMGEVARRSERELSDFRRQLRLDDATFRQIGVVLTGSFARREVTDTSDCDFLVLVDGLVPHGLITRAIQQVNDLAREKRYGDVGSQGVFGDFAIGTELMARIGLDADTNVNTTRRLLMLFESVSVFNDEVRERLIRQLLERYCTDYDPRSSRSNIDRVNVPRFLLNDLVRYWRTMAVDFGA